MPQLRGNGPTLGLNTPSLTNVSKSKNGPNMTKVFSKLGLGPIGPQHSPVIHPESLRSRQCCFEGLELNSSYLDFLFHLSLLLSEILDHLLFNRPFQVLLYYCNHLVQLQALSINIFKHLAGFILHRL
jgi:hypothetical protein